MEVVNSFQHLNGYEKKALVLRVTRSQAQRMISFHQK